MKPRETNLTAEQLRDILSYDPATGEFRWRKRIANCVKIGSIAGSKNAKGYWWVVIYGEHHYAHRLAWLYMTGEWPADCVDHRDVDKLNNRWENLRAACHSENGTNRKLFPNNTSGYKGVSWHKRMGKFQAHISKNRVDRYLGTFDDAESASEAYVKASEKYHGEFARAE